MATLTLTVGKPFEWRRGLCLQAIDGVQLVLPGALWVQGKALRNVIEISDDEVRMAFDQANDGKVRKIHIFLKSGQHVTLHRNSEAIAVAEGREEVRMSVLEGPNAA